MAELAEWMQGSRLSTSSTTSEEEDISAERDSKDETTTSAIPTHREITNIATDNGPLQTAEQHPQTDAAPPPETSINTGLEESVSIPLASFFHQQDSSSVPRGTSSASHQHHQHQKRVSIREHIHMSHPKHKRQHEKYSRKQSMSISISPFLETCQSLTCHSIDTSSRRTNNQSSPPRHRSNRRHGTSLLLKPRRSSWTVDTDDENDNENDDGDDYILAEAEETLRNNTNFNSKMNKGIPSPYHDETSKTWHRLRQLSGIIVRNDSFKRAIIILIMLSSALLGVQTFDSVAEHSKVMLTLEIVDTIFLVIFSLEISLQLIYRGTRFCEHGWLVFDVIVVLLSWVFFKFQALRVMRILRLVTRVRELKGLVRYVLLYFY